MPINSVGTVSVFVADQQCAKDFYTNTLGFDLRTDAELYPGQKPAGSRWPLWVPKPNLFFTSQMKLEDSEGNNILLVEQPKG